MAPSDDESAALRSLSASVIEAVKASEGVLSRSNHQTPILGSTLWRAFEDAGALGGRSHLTDAVLQAEYGMLSACDHSRAFSSLIRGERRFSTALVTLCRGSLESLARVRWLIQDLDFGTLAHRSISLLYADLRYPELHRETLLSRDGSDIDPAERRRYYLSELKRLGQPPPARIEISRLVDDLVSADIAHQSGTHLYSMMSSVAHGHRAAINAFIQTSPEREVLGLRSSLPTITEFALQIVVTLVETTDAMIRWYGDPEDECARLNTAASRIAARVSALPSVAYLSDE